MTTGLAAVSGHVTVGLTAGASTPNNIVGQVIKKLEDVLPLGRL